MAIHDIMKGSPAWDRLQDGIPEGIAPQDLRRILHDYASVTTTLVNAINELADDKDRARDEIALALARAQEAVNAAKDDVEKEHVRIHLRIDRRGDDINALGTSVAGRIDSLRDRLFDSEKGVLPTYAKKTDVSKLTVLLWTALVSITTAAIMLALNLVAAKGG